MPAPTPQQRERFAAAVREAISRYSPDFAVNGIKIRPDEYIAQQMGVTSQAIRNYAAGLRVPRRLEDIERLEDALALHRGVLARHLGFPGPVGGVLKFEFPNLIFGRKTLSDPFAVMLEPVEGGTRVTASGQGKGEQAARMAIRGLA